MGGIHILPSNAKNQSKRRSKVLAVPNQACRSYASANGMKLASSIYLKSIELSGSRARFIARERGHSKPTLKDLVEACIEMMPVELRVVTAAALPEKLARRGAPAPPLQPRCSRPAEQESEPGNVEFSRRQIAPTRHNLEAVSTA
jgi:hypothetical protein